MSNLKYKTAQTQDIPLLVEMDQTIFNRDFDQDFPVEKFYQDLFQKNHQTSFIYLNDQVIGSYSWIHLSETEAEIMSIAILPQYQGQGFVTTTLEMMLSKLQAKEDIRIVTHPHNIVALKLYMNYGFIIYDYRPKHYGLGQPRVLLHKKKNQ